MARLEELRSELSRTARVLVGRVREAVSMSVARTALITAAVLVFDWSTPLGVSAGVLYMASVLSAVPIRHPRAVYFTAAICTVLVLAGWILSPSRGATELWKVVVNRGLSVGVILAAAAMADSWNRLQQRRAKQLQESRLLQQATAFSSAQVSFAQALQNSLKTLCDILGWSTGHVYFRASGGHLLVSSEIWHLPPDGRYDLVRTAAKNLRFGHGDGVPGRVWQTGEPLYVRDVGDSPDYVWLHDPGRLGVRGAFALPITVGGQVAAVLEFLTEEEIDVDPEFMPLARNVGEQLGRLFERKRAEEALRESEERLRLAIQGGKIGTWEWQIDAGRLIWSPELERMHGLEAGTFEGTFDAFAQTIHREDRDRVLQQVQRAVQRGQEFHSEFRIVRPDDSVQWLEGRGAVHPPAAGQSRRMVGVCVDITERKISEDETRQAKEAAEDANRLRTQFLANVSHELRTPMNAILGMLQLALDEGLSAELRDWLSTAKGSADSLLKLLDDLLDFSKLEAGRARLQSEPFPLRKTVDEAVRPLAPMAFEKGLEVVLEIRTNVPDVVVGDADRLRQVLANLLTNAMKFTERGEIVVRVETEQELPDEARLRFTVSDTGVGILPENQRRIFEPFAQADASSTRQYGGVGLGLAICSELVRQMGGQLSVESRPGAGSRFTFSLTLPREKQDGSPGQDGSPRQEGAPCDALRELPVLVVDDNATNRRLLDETLRTWSAAPDVAVDGDHALGKLHRAVKEGRGYRLLIVDARMPGLDGFSLAEQVAGDFKDPPPIVLMISSTDRRMLHEREQRAPCAAYVEKPVSPGQLFEALLAALQIQPPMLAPILPPVSTTRASRPLLILLAEDTVANQKVAVTALQRRGHVVHVAENGREAVELWKANPYDLVLMDVQMPIMDGYEATATIREQECGTARRRTPIVAMTAHAMEGDRQRCLAADMDSYLAKPLIIGRLIELTESLAAGCAHPAGVCIKDHSSLQDAEAPPETAQRDGPMTHATTIVDYEAAMRRLGGDQELFAHLIQIFDEDSPPFMETIRESADEKNADALHRAAHSLKGLIANFGAARALDFAQQLEQMGRSGDLGDASIVIEELEQELSRLSQALHEFNARGNRGTRGATDAK